MAHLYPAELPNYIRRDPKRSAEVEFYDALKLQLGAGWVVFYSVAWLGLTSKGDPPQDGETDFIVAHPEHGVLLLEVKGGRIAYDGIRGTWTTTDHNGNMYDISPFAQVRKCKYALLELLKSMPQWRDRWITLGHAVVFPHASSSSCQFPADASPHIIFYAEDLLRLHSCIREIMGFWRGQNGTDKNGAELVAELRQRLAPTMMLPIPLAVQVAAEERELVRLTEEQYLTLDLLRRTRRAAISGCAGSGKTMLAAEKARRLSQDGFRTLLICTSSPLVEYLSQALADLAHVHVRTLAELCADAAEDAGLPEPASTDDRPQTLSEAMAARPALHFDAILVDEGQEFDDLSWLALEECLRENGIFYVFYDDNQRVANPHGCIPAGLQPITLCENVRNTRAISQAMKPFYFGDGNLRARGPRRVCAGNLFLRNTFRTACAIGPCTESLSHLRGHCRRRYCAADAIPQ